MNINTLTVDYGYCVMPLNELYIVQYNWHPMNEVGFIPYPNTYIKPDWSTRKDAVAIWRVKAMKQIA